MPYNLLLQIIYQAFIKHLSSIYCIIALLHLII